MMRALVVAIALLAGLPVAADLVADATAAYEAGDLEKAVALLRVSAGNGDPRAQYNLALLYDNGKGVAESKVEAAKWYRRAAEQGHARAQIELGSSRALGEGVPFDYVEAYKWLTLGAARISDEKQRATAESVRRSVASLMTPEQVELAERQAREWAPKPEAPAPR
jgi:uncharacterized protein